MSSFHNIQQKLHGFIRKYYTNELIKGSILFISFGLLYLLFTLLVEYFLWLDPMARTILFWVFIIVEFSLLLKYILFPLFKLFGLSKGINLEDASVIIGTHFKEIDDKLVNMLQLNDGSFESEFALASIAQRADELEPIPFKKAITFKKNKKYIKYLLIPLVIWVLTMFSGEEEILSSSYKRVINHQQVYIPPAPFLFSIKNQTLSVIEGSTLELVIETQGNVVPSEATIIYNNEDYFLKNKEIGVFGFSFENVQKPITFRLKANDVTSKEYIINVIQTPKIQGVSMYLDYPNYVQKKDELIKNTGNIIIPTGTNITWKIATEDTDSLHFVTEQQKISFSNKVKPNEYRLTKNIRNSVNYQIKASNKHLKDFENLSFGISVIQDELPHMDIKTDIDSITRGEAQFVGHLSDDYGLSKLQIEYYPKLQKEQIVVHVIPISKSTIADFYYIFPRNLNLIAGVDYEFYFKVFDNDAVKGSKSVKSKTYSYHKDTENEVQEKLLEEQKQSLDDFNKTLEKQKKNQLDLDELKKDLQNKSEIEFNDTKKLEKFMKRQEEYQEMMQRQTEELQQNLEQQPKLDNKQLQEKKEAIQERLEESKKLAKNEKLLDELRKLAEKMKKEDLVEKIKKLSKNNQQKEKSLEQLLELTKRFYVEQKAEQISEELKELAKKQEELSEKLKEENTKEKQEELNKEFEDIQKDMEELQKQNKELQEPLDIEEKKTEQEAVKKEQNKATEELEQQQQEKASKSQKSAAKKMMEMSSEMKAAMAAASGDMIEEDIAMLRQIIENLITFSYKQESLMNDLTDMHKNHPGYSKKLKQQNKLKNFFEHIDDSLFVLAMRQPKMSGKINEYLADAHYYLDETLYEYTEFKMSKVVSNQQYVMTSANNLAYLLSSLLDNMQNSMGKGKGKGKGMGMGEGEGDGKGFSLPDIIKKQEALGEKMKGKKPGGEKEGESGEDGKSGKDGEGENGKDGKSGEGGGEGKDGKGGEGGEQSASELYEIYKQQAMLRQAIENQLNDMQGTGAKAQANEVKRQMEELEQMLLDKGINNEVLQKLQNLEHELLKLKEATQEQGKESKREATTNRKKHDKPTPKQLEFKNKYYKTDEILNREVLPMKSQYKKKVQEYFRKSID